MIFSAFLSTVRRCAAIVDVHETHLTASFLSHQKNDQPSSAGVNHPMAHGQFTGVAFLTEKVLWIRKHHAIRQTEADSAVGTWRWEFGCSFHPLPYAFRRNPRP